MSAISDLLDRARARLRRLDPRDAADAVDAGALLVDIRPGWQRLDEGTVPGAVVIERNHLEWRLDPTSDARIPEAVDHDVQWIVVCSEGYASSLAAAHGDVVLRRDARGAAAAHSQRTGDGVSLGIHAAATG